MVKDLSFDELFAAHYRAVLMILVVHCKIPSNVLARPETRAYVNELNKGAMALASQNASLDSFRTASSWRPSIVTANSSSA